MATHLTKLSAEEVEELLQSEFERAMRQFQRNLKNGQRARKQSITLGRIFNSATSSSETRISIERSRRLPPAPIPVKVIKSPEIVAEALV
mmetsp:Transcript_17088/g.21044  ORF Transcript_17088/g.21044 Transcript_17088/m.21044 type:complete len:90 (+) Transcript_17088:657-926(+)|eukprot:CAMPEP_0204822856 /NCGR_PEP_ID=MMETSP1346-20131115/1037_1 /ASSEMBLY_ACC=CAM_ASM_000771 /TAXON_ID=215587 /ORGANISM="Aplanochytrium stocchinoi, Strain GSBS06" /LENGTH=89 /DNA_ID=CAMNT_0051949301 /DNA_START=404 /DNA_END=673 /DNA_ORIENTATION=-